MKTKLFRILPLTFVIFGCAPGLSRETIRNHPRIDVTVLEPQIVERSAPFPPPWTLRPDRGAVAYVSFIGQASGSSIDQAKADAQRDLLAAIASFISVEVDSEFEAVERESQQGGQSSASFEARSLVRTKARAELQGVRPDETYWEKMIASPLSPGDVSYHFHVYAKVAKEEIGRARLKKLLARQQKSGKRLVVVLPFQAVLASADLEPLAQAFAEELSRHLGASPELHASDPGLVRALLAGSRSGSESETLETVRDALLPDSIVSGNYQLHQGRLRVTYTIHKASGAPVVKSIERPYAELFRLQDELIAAISSEVGAVAGKAAATPRPADETANRLAAFEAYHGAFALYQAGQNDAAIQQLQRALQLQPRYFEAQLRLGRVLERLGKYGRIPPIQAADAPGTGSWFRDPCTPWHEITGEPRETFLTTAEAAAIAGEAAPLTLPTGANVDHVLSAALYSIGGGTLAEPDVAPIPDSAAGAYWNALAIALESGDLRAEAEALLALAELALKVDRVARAEQLFNHVHAWAAKEGRLHERSLAAFGLGRASRQRGDLRLARHWLDQALADRALLGEKPYLVEIYNELAGLAVELSDYATAYHRYSQARRLADDLQDDYLRAVLANNLGVLLLINGETLRAERYFSQAWDYLKDLDEKEGQISSGLNVGHLAGLKGDPERALAYLREAHRIVGATQQEGRLAQIYDHRATSALSRGAATAALRDLLRGWALYDRGGRSLESLRLRANAAVADYHAWLGDSSAPSLAATRLRCVQETLGDILLLGYGNDRPGLSWLHYVPPSRYSRGGYYPGEYHPAMMREQPQPRLYAPQGLSFHYATLNGEVVARLRP